VEEHVDHETSTVAGGASRNGEDPAEPEHRSADGSTQAAEEEAMLAEPDENGGVEPYDSSEDLACAALSFAVYFKTLYPHVPGGGLWRADRSRVSAGRGAPAWVPPLRAARRQPRGKLMVSLVNSRINATRIGWHL